MFFELRRVLSLLIGLSLFLGLSGCGLKLGESSPVSSMELGMSSTACLKGGDQVMVNLIQGHASEAEVRTLWDCAGQAIQVFTERTRGEKIGVYSPSELRGFLEAYFINPGNLKKGDSDYIQISDRLLAELMNLKRAFVGGSADVLTAEELSHSRRIIQVLKEQSLQLRPYFPLNSQHLSSLNEFELQKLRTVLEQAALAIGAVLKETGYDYSLSNLDALLDELSRISSTPEIASSMEETRHKIPLLKTLKALLYGPDTGRVSGVISSHEWVDILWSISRAYGIYLRWVHEQSHHSVEFFRFLSEGREGILDIGQRVLDILDEVARRYPGEAIPLKVFEDLIDQFEPQSFVSGKVIVSQDHLKKFLCPLALKIFSNAPTEENPCQAWDQHQIGFKKKFDPDLSLTRQAIKRARDLLEEWSEGQNFIDLLYQRLSQQMGIVELDRLERSHLLSIGIPQAYGKSKSEISAETWKIASKIRGLISSRRPFFRDEEEIYMGPTEVDPVFSRRDLNYLNLMSFFGRLLISSYGGSESSRIDKKVQEQELKDAYFDFRDLGVDLKIFDPRKNTIYKKRLLESNIFTWIGDGDDSMNAEEAAQILAYMYSSKNLGKRAHELMTDICNHGGQIGVYHERDQSSWDDSSTPHDLFGYELINADCYRREYFRNHTYIWKNFPQLEAYYNGLTSEKKTQFSKNFELVARTLGYSQEPVESTDSESFGGLAHYIETFFQRFDRNSDGLLSEEEAVEGPRSAFAVLRNTLATASCKAGHCLKKSGDLEDLLTYLLHYGDVPSGAWSFLRWKGTRPFVRIEADRGRMIEILAKLATAMGNQEVRKQVSR